MHAYEVMKDDGETGKGIEPVHINCTAELNNGLTKQKMIKADWAMIKEALEAGVTGIK
jgi:hypothetical protein